MKTETIKKWQAEAIADLAKFREVCISADQNRKVEIEVWRLRVYQHKINDLCAVLLDGKTNISAALTDVVHDKLKNNIANEINEMLGWL